MKLEPILVLMLMLIPPGFASSGNASINNTTTAENHIAINESDPVYWYNKGEVLLNSGRYNESIDAYNKAIELNQSFEAAWRQKCNAFFKLSQYNKTVECNKRAMELERSDAKAWYNKGFSLQAEYDAARKAFDKDTDLSTSVCPCQMH